jgi:hypothetical protein
MVEEVPKIMATHLAMTILQIEGEGEEYSDKVAWLMITTLEPKTVHLKSLECILMIIK